MANAKENAHGRTAIMTRVLFVCLGNICRSPTAEGVFKNQIKSQSLEDQFLVDSCGTIAEHEGESPDVRMRKHAQARGYNLDSVARGLVADDLNEFDIILTMDDSNFANVSALASDDQKHKIRKMTDFCQSHTQPEVPDPYYGGPDGFELVLDLLEDACQGLLQELSGENGSQ